MTRRLKILAVVTRAVNGVGLRVKKYSPEMLLVGGVICVVTGTVVACKQTLKIEEILDEHQKKRSDICYAEEDGATAEEYSHEDAKKDRAILVIRTGGKICKLYAGAAGFEAVGLAMIFASHGIMRRRNAALLAAYKTLDLAFNEYRDRVRGRFGENIERQIFHGVEMDDVVDEGTGEVVGKQLVRGGEHVSQYAQVFGPDTSICWQRDLDQNLFFLRKQEQYANERCREQGHFFLNEAYDLLGLPRTEDGQYVGWVYGGMPDRNGKRQPGVHEISFGIFDFDNPLGVSAEDFARNANNPDNKDRSLFLDFNVDGVISDMLPSLFRR